MLAGLDGERDLLAEERVVRAQEVLSRRDFRRERLAEHQRDFRAGIQTRDDLPLADVLRMIAAHRHDRPQVVELIRPRGFDDRRCSAAREQA